MRDVPSLQEERKEWLEPNLALMNVVLILIFYNTMLNSTTENMDIQLLPRVLSWLGRPGLPTTTLQYYYLQDERPHLHRTRVLIQSALFEFSLMMHCLTVFTRPIAFLEERGRM